MNCLNCENAGVLSEFEDRDDHRFCIRCGQREEKPEPVYKSPYYRYPTEV